MPVCTEALNCGRWRRVMDLRSLSREMQQLYSAAFPGRDTVSMDVLYARLGSLGTSKQRASAAKSRMLMMAMGPAAEARELDLPLADVISSQSCLADLADIRNEATLVEGSRERANEIIVAMCLEANRLMGTRDVWQAVNAIADNVKGGLSGARIADLARPYIQRLAVDAIEPLVDDLAVMCEPIKERGSHFDVADDGGPFTEREFGGDDARGGATWTVTHNQQRSSELVLQWPSDARDGGIDDDDPL